MRRAQFSRSSILLLAGDWLALALFVLIGQREHGLIAANPLPRLLATTLALAGPWTAVVLVRGAYRPPAPGQGRAFLGQALTTWLVAAPLALMVRAYLNDQAAIILIFMAITMGLGGALLLSWRALFLLWWRRRGTASAASSPSRNEKGLASGEPSS